MCVCVCVCVITNDFWGWKWKRKKKKEKRFGFYGLLAKCVRQTGLLKNLPTTYYSVVIYDIVNYEIYNVMGILPFSCKTVVEIASSLNALWFIWLVGLPMIDISLYSIVLNGFSFSFSFLGEPNKTKLIICKWVYATLKI